MSNENQNQNENQGQSVLKKKRQKTTLKQNKLYTEYNLSEEEMKDQLYIDYLAVEPNKRGILQDERRKFLIKKEREYKDQRKEFPKWAEQELNYLREAKRKHNNQYLNTQLGKEARVRNGQKNSKKYRQLITTLKEKRDPLNPQEKALLERHSEREAGYRRAVRINSSLIAYGLWEKLSEKELRRVLTHIRGIVASANRGLIPAYTIYGITLSEELKQIALSHDMPRFKEYLKQHSPQIEAGNIDLSSNQLNSNKHEAFLPLNEDDEGSPVTEQMLGNREDDIQQSGELAGGDAEEEYEEEGYDYHGEEYNEGQIINPYEPQAQNQNIRQQGQPTNLDDAYENALGETRK